MAVPLGDDSIDPMRRPHARPGQAGGGNQHGTRDGAGERERSSKPVRHRARTRSRLVFLLTSIWVAGMGFVWVPPARAAACEYRRCLGARSCASRLSPAADASVIQVQGEDEPKPRPSGFVASRESGGQHRLRPRRLSAELTAVSEALAACLSEGDAEDGG